MPTYPDDECRRRMVFQELKIGLELKMITGSPVRAQEHLERAHSLATAPTPLPWPTPQVTAYRLAHLLLRSAKHEADLRRIEALLAMANDGGRLLGPQPVCVHLAVLHRLRAMGRSADLEGQIGFLFGALVDYIRNSRTIEVREANALQGNALNLLELSAYFLGAEYDLLEGLDVVHGDPHAGLGGGEPWLVVGTGKIDASVQMPKHLAIGEVHERLDTGRADVVFIHEGSTSMIKTSRGIVKTPRHAPRLLAMICHGTGHNGLERAFSAHAFRKLVERTRAALAQPLGRENSDIIRSGDRYAFADDIRVAGALPSRLWRSLPTD